MDEGNQQLKIWSIRIAIVVALLGLWEIAGALEGELFLPRASSTFVAWVQQLGTEELWEAVLRSNQAIAFGFPLSVAVGIPLGLALGRVRRLDSLFGYYMDLMLVLPMIAVVPIIIAAFGLTLWARVAVVVLFTLPVIAMDSRAAVRVIDEQRVEMARSFTATRPQIWSKVILPLATGPIFAGLRLGISRAVSGMIVIELTLVPAGLGGLISSYGSQFRAVDLYAVTATIIVQGVLLVALARILERNVKLRLSGGVRA